MLLIDGGERGCGELLLLVLRQVRGEPAGSIIGILTSDPAVELTGVQQFSGQRGHICDPARHPVRRRAGEFTARHAERFQHPLRQLVGKAVAGHRFHRLRRDLDAPVGVDAPAAGGCQHVVRIHREAWANRCGTGDPAGPAALSSPSRPSAQTSRTVSALAILLTEAHEWRSAKGVTALPPKMRY